MAISARPPADRTASFTPTRASCRACELLLNGMQPLLLGSNVRDDNSVLTVDLTNPDIYFEQKLVLPKDTLHIVRTLFLWRGTAYQRLRYPQSRRSARQPAAVARFRQRLCRRVRGARHQARAARHRDAARSTRAGRSMLHYEGLDGRAAHHAADFRSGADRARRRASASYAHRARARGNAARCSSHVDLRRATARNKVRCRSSAGMMRGLARSAERSAKAATTVETSNELFNRGAVPFDGRPLHADDQDPAGPLSLCRHPLVFDHVRARRHHHGDADAVVRSRIWRAACCGGSPPIRPRTSTRSTTPSPARSCMRCARARWRRCARCRSASITAASIPRRLFVMLAGLYAERTGDDETLRELWPNIEAALGWIDGPGDPRRRRLCRILPADRAGPCQPGLEGFARRRIPCRWPTGGGPDRARRGAGLTSMRPSS